MPPINDNSFVGVPESWTTTTTGSTNDTGWFVNAPMLDLQAQQQTYAEAVAMQEELHRQMQEFEPMIRPRNRTRGHLNRDERANRHNPDESGVEEEDLILDDIC